MSPHFMRLSAAIAASAFLFACLAWIDGPDGFAQEPKPPAANAGASETLSAIHCIGCHGGPETPAYKAYSQKEGKLEPRTDFILLTEYHTWKNDDLHAQAHANIVPKFSADKQPENLAGKMQRVLEASPTRAGKNYSVERAAECLTCHSVDRKPGPITDAALVGGDRFYHESGVSCEACHGLVKDEWIGQHIQRGWREQSGATKQKSGQVDLRDPAQRAAKCASCHVGNKEEGKFVTHEMYAAGHPPLPPFELVTYCRDEPRHSIPLRDNKAIMAMTPEQQALFHYQKGVLTDARDFAIGTLAAFEATMKLLSDDARGAVESSNLLDFAHFDCYACHHDLKVDSDRQRPRKGITPGRPVMRPWATETLQVVLAHAENTSGGKEKAADRTRALPAGIDKLNAAFNARAFGDATKVAAEAGELAKLCGQLRGELQKVTYSQEETVRLYGKLADRLKDLRANNTPIDHDTAQQMAWGLLVLQDALNPPKKDAPAKEFPTLDNVVRLRLRGMERESVEKRLDGRYKQIYDFRRNAFLDAGDAFLKSFEPK